MSEHQAAEVIVYTTSSTSLPKTKKDVQSLRFLLDSKRVLYEEYDVSLDSMRRNEMWAKSNERTLPQVCVNVWCILESLSDILLS